MTDIANHSPEIWRSFIFYYPYDYELKRFAKEYCEEYPFKYSWQSYGEANGEKAHISVRIAFPNLESLEDFRRELNVYLEECTGSVAEYEETGYDEAQGTKMAYVLGTELYHNFKENYGLFRGNVSEFLMLLLHGFFNDLGYVYADEMKFYNYAIGRLLQQMYGN